ncbi:uncharacterized protein MELLADRAFT_109397 [Melampsora larici-populina 98AG31]|uniref:Secreted protein n=1 Tax=Melampsora larici-populina (strain 98AG31 / pathotype 3-4-7) TaxID=747676 RepID=F4RWC3_MELLP|nr:uncharacterized protein MELLADRAFT_109397 [Melampsora larici-populina 98AG31]EGG03347.1 hypothetical protein MELLADRAFT_109397 [Melampsora larici-populina 98AG31]
MLQRCYPGVLYLCLGITAILTLPKTLQPVKSCSRSSRPLVHQDNHSVANVFQLNITAILTLPKTSQTVKYCSRSSRQSLCVTNVFRVHLPPYKHNKTVSSGPLTLRTSHQSLTLAINNQGSSVSIDLSNTNMNNASSGALTLRNPCQSLTLAFKKRRFSVSMDDGDTGTNISQ